MTDQREANDASRQRLANAAQLSEDSLAGAVDEMWTCGALLAHLAFWDRLVLGRWRHAGSLAHRVPEAIPDYLADLINDALIPEWRAVPPRLAAQLALTAAEEIDTFIDGLDATIVEAAHAADLPRLVDRTRHRTEHLDMIDRALAGRRP
jgi:hypothetical protein